MAKGDFDVGWRVLTFLLRPPTTASQQRNRMRPPLGIVLSVSSLLSASGLATADESAGSGSSGVSGGACTATSGEKYWDLSPLAKAYVHSPLISDWADEGGCRKDYVVDAGGGVGGKVKMTLNVCKAVSSEMWNLGDGVDVDTVGGFFRGEHGDVSIGCVLSFSLCLFPS